MAATNDGRAVAGGPAQPVYITNATGDPVPTTGGGGGGGSGDASAANQTTQIAAEQAIQAALGAPADAAATTDAGTFSLIALFKRLLGKLTTQLPAALGPQTAATSLSVTRPTTTATLQTGATATGNGTAWSVAGLEFATLHLGGITTATITWETLNDATSGWTGLIVTNQTTGVQSTTASADGIYGVNCAGLSQIRARISAYTAGTITVSGRGA